MSKETTYKGFHRAWADARQSRGHSSVCSGSQLLVTLVPKDPTSSPASAGTMHAPGAQTYMQAKHACMQKK